MIPLSINYMTSNTQGGTSLNRKVSRSDSRDLQTSFVVPMDIHGGEPQYYTNNNSDEPPRLETQPRRLLQAEDSVQKKRPWWLLFVLGTLVIAAIGGGVYYYFMHQTTSSHLKDPKAKVEVKKCSPDFFEHNGRCITCPV